MISNDKEFQDVSRRYMRSKGAEWCGNGNCNDCLLKGTKVRPERICIRDPFRKIEEYEKNIEQLKKEIEIMEMWEKETGSDLVRELQDICNTLRSRAKEPKCPRVVCEECPFYDIRNFTKWMIYMRRQD